MELITVSFLSKGPVKAIELQIKQHGNVTLLHYNGSKITRVPLDVISTELSMAFSPSNQYFCRSFLQWSKFCGKQICGNFILLELIFADRGKNHKNRKN